MFVASGDGGPGAAMAGAGADAVETPLFRTHWISAGIIAEVSVRANENNCPLVKAFICTAFLKSLTVSEVGGISTTTKLGWITLAYT